MQIFNIGSLNIDYVYNVEHFVRPGETLSSEKRSVFPGGKGLNQSIALKKAGADVTHIGIVGNDGQFLLDTLQNADIDTSSIKRTDGASGHAIIQIDSTGQNCILLFSGANHTFDKSFILSALKNAKENDILLLQNEINCLNDIFSIAKEKKLLIAFNPSPFNNTIKALPLDYVWLWILNEIEGEEITNKQEPSDIINALSKLNPQSNILLTLGKKGAIYKETNSNPIYQSIIESDTVDTTAAGDTFTGFFLSTLSKGDSAEKALLYATAASSIGVSRVGASSSIPTLSEVESLLEKIK